MIGLNRPIWLLLILSVSLGLIVSGCVQSPPSPTPTPTSASTPVASAPTVAPSPTATATVATATPSVVPTSTATPTSTASPTASATATSTAAATPGSSGSARPTPAAGISGEAALRHVQRLSAEIGSRVVGTQAESAAAEYVASQLQTMGFTVQRQSFPYVGSEDRPAQLTVEAPRRLEIEARALRLAPAGEVAGSLIDAGLGRPADYASIDARGKVALVGRGEITFEDKVKNAAADGAVGVIIYNNEPGIFSGMLNETGAIPGVSVSQEDGAQLRTLVQQGPTNVRILVRSASREGTSQNVIGTRPGRQNGTVVLGAHMDSVAAGPGANDNASGVATMLEVARALAAADYPYTLKVIAFGAEEIGLVGSRYYVNNLSAEERRGIVAMVNLDMVGVGDTMRLVGTERLVNLAGRAAQEAGIDFARLTDSRAQGSDHASFLNANVPSIFFTWTPDPNYHTARDTVAAVKPATLAATGNTALAVLRGLPAAS